MTHLAILPFKEVVTPGKFRNASHRLEIEYTGFPKGRLVQSRLVIWDLQQCLMTLAQQPEFLDGMLDVLLDEQTRAVIIFREIDFADEDPQTSILESGLQIHIDPHLLRHENQRQPDRGVNDWILLCSS